MAGYRITLYVFPSPGIRGGPGVPADLRPVVRGWPADGPSARAAAFELSRIYLGSGWAVEWTARPIGLAWPGRRWSGRFAPSGGDDDGLSGVREPRRPYPPVGSARAARV
ncbi:hypothetical protein SPF06_15495 [Sinomonas sp. JGH33]|uniref:Uncharacterized protein n=1 Tax=Sinomonas terricola TaxID=3110330 RepID=A0ABU5T8V8_9MICC|nr:hypothetical protein [Sinomonas sp. JGH33]MEA5456139.1 hypothetical protein [Sinomonas sp. JGH33]